ncbi:polysaccharide biosynthesis protein [Paenibacillus sp. GD4]|uniref:polysaccharide biosynthesis protein n=1 Tax=Paenibacillus sp. GD4 TaxID=3068890 RepID=UPI002796A219|nr:polysaccharide biosynthesis protein [Paenibacillus sp. GD4]MDQ1910943.1 polysaccharide biosynthesis protein [Paenibacillus sp. GD4]
MERRTKGTQPGETLLKGAAVLGLAAVASKLIGTLQKIPLQNIAGDEVFGIYNAVYPLYILILFMATAGFPLVVAKFVADYAAEARYGEARRVLKVSLVMLSVTGLAGFAGLYWGADRIAGWIGVPQTALAIRSVSFALLLVPLLSALRGYYQGFHDMVPTAWSQVVEQTVRVAAMFGLLLWFMHAGYGPEWIAAGATFGSVAGGVGGLLVLLWLWRRSPRGMGERGGARLPWKEQRRLDVRLLGRLVLYAIPICLGSIALPVLTLVDSFLVPRVLIHSGLSEMEALYQFGLYNHGIPLVSLAAMIASSLTGALVPAIAEAKRRGDALAVRQRTAMSLKVTWLIGLGASVGLAMLAEPMNIMFYEGPEGTTAMVILSFTAVFSVMHIIAGSVLQGFGAIVAPAVYLLLAAGVKIAAGLALVPRYGIDGAAVAAVAAYALAGTLALAHARAPPASRPRAASRP